MGRVGSCRYCDVLCATGLLSKYSGNGDVRVLELELYAGNVENFIEWIYKMQFEICPTNN